MKFLPALFILFLSFSVKAEDTNVFENVTVGFKVTKPNDWQFVTVKDNFDNLKKVKNGQSGIQTNDAQVFYSTISSNDETPRTV